MGNKNHDFLTHRQKYRVFCRRVDIKQLLGGIILIGMTSCSTVGLLVGTKDPVSVKSAHYDVLDLSQENASVWKRIDPSQTNQRKNGEDQSTEVSDVVFQSRKTASIISLNSSCREGGTQMQKSLRELTQLLLLGVENLSERKERHFQVQLFPALETSVHGSVDGKQRRFQIVVLKADQCVYDLMYFASPKSFPAENADFERFVASLKIES